MTSRTATLARDLAFVLGVGVASEDTLAAAPTTPTACAPSRKERALAELITRDPEQRRAVLVCDPLLEAVARERARDMATRRYFRHHTPEGVGPNDLLRARGFDLPGSYPTGRANTVEAIVGGFPDPKEVWEQLKGSTLHRAHTLGEDPTYLEQDLFGIGYVHEWHTPQVDFWVVLIARRAVPGEAEMLCSPPPSECIQRSTTKYMLEPGKPGPDQAKPKLREDIKGLDRRG